MASQRGQETMRRVFTKNYSQTDPAIATLIPLRYLNEGEDQARSDFEGAVLTRVAKVSEEVAMHLSPALETNFRHRIIEGTHVILMFVRVPDVAEGVIPPAAAAETVQFFHIMIKHAMFDAFPRSPEETVLFKQLADSLREESLLNQLSRFSL